MIATQSTSTSTSAFMQRPRLLSPTQQYLLQVFAHNSEDSLKDIQSMLLKYHQSKVDAEADKLWHELDLSEGKMDEILNTHCRTSYQ